jgi:anti-sigma B factor antagonist
MMNVTVHNFGNVTLLRCRGRIVAGDENTILQEAAFFKATTKTLVLDLRQVDAIDAGGLGLLVSLLKWARYRRIHFKLANLTPKVRHLFELTRLDRIFSMGAIPETRECSRRAADLDQERTEQPEFFQPVAVDF